ncbi:MAG: orotidine-5'-phosphate decarboxylase [Candidatus Hodarchaeota archaeon]
MKGKKGIIFAADLTDERKCLNILREIEPHIDSIKVGFPLLLNSGFKIIHEIKKICNLPVIADFKIIDIPEIIIKIILAAIDAGIDGVMLCGLCGPLVINECILAAKDIMIFIFTELTYADGFISQDLADATAEMARDLGVYGIQAPATKEGRVRKMRQIVGNDLVIISCGIKTQGPSPGSAIEEGADYEIIGRSIYESQNPKQSAKSIREKLKLSGLIE